MSKLYYSSILMVLVTLLFIHPLFSKDKNNVKALDPNPPSPPFSPTVDVDLFFEGWEGGALIPWTSADESSIPPQWHLTSWMPYGGSGMSWHMADATLGTNGGYNNSWYQVLDTDPISLTGTNLQLTFYHRFNCEAAGGEPAGYDGWDGMNCRVSSDGGTTWNVLTNPTPAYTSTSLYSFGNEHGEGQGIPGWGGNLNAWTLVTFDLSSYAGQSVMIRFAFASDGSYSTPNDSALFGWEVDDIMVTNSTSTLFSNDGNSSQMTPSNNLPAGSDLWKVVQNGAFAGSYYASCNNASNTYEPNMQNSLTSDWFILDPLATDIYMDFFLQGTYDDNDAFPAVDFFGAYVQVKGELDWRYVSNITKSPSGSNFVYSGAPPTWASFSTSYSIPINLTPLKGDTIRIIFEFFSDEDTTIGTGLQVDNIRVWTPNLVPVELTSFTANTSNGTVILNWITATEINNRIFEIERKTETSQFITVGFIDGHGTTAEEQSYTYIDSKVDPGVYSYRLKQIDYDGSFEYSDAIEVNVNIPLEFSLSQNYPNPFNPVTNIKYSLAEAGNIKLALYNVLGQQVKELVNGYKEAGRYEINFNASELSSGAYFYKIETAQFNQIKKMLLTK